MRNKQDYLDYVWKDSVKESLARTSTSTGKPLAGASRSGHANRHSNPRCDAWIRALLVLNVPGSIEYVPFEELIDRAIRVERATRQTVDGRELVVVRLVVGKSKEQKVAWEVELHFDPAANYLVRKATYSQEGSKGTYKRWEEVVEFKEYEPGIFFPEKVVGGSSLGGKQDSTNNAQFAQVSINRPLPEGVFQLKYPHGIPLRDNVRGVDYRADSAGNPITTPTPIRKKSLPPPPVGEGAAPRLMTTTDEEPRSLTRWILPVSLALVLVGGIAIGIRRGRTSRIETESAN